MGLDEASYRQILGDISGLCESRLDIGGGERNRDLVETYWRIGRMIVAAEGSEIARSSRGAGVVQRLSADLVEKYGAGFSVSNLFSMRRFGLIYELNELVKPLAWSHYRLLTALNDRETRRQLEAKVRSGEMGVRALAVAVTAAQTALIGAGKDANPSNLKRRAGQLGLFRLEAIGSVQPMLDAGFGVKLPCTLKINDELVERSIVRIEGERLESMPVMLESERHCYRAQVLRVIDGDTMLFAVELGFGARIEQRFRLRGLDGAELASAEGSRIKEALAKQLTGAWVVVQTYGTDIYGRYVADVFLLNENFSGLYLTPGQDGVIFLNQALLEGNANGYVARHWG